MSILSQVFEKKISWSTGLSEATGWFGTLIAKASPAVQEDAAVGLTDFKQTLSDAVGLADTALGPILSTGTLAVEAAANAALTAAFGALVGAELSPGLDAGITSVSNALKAEVDAVAAQLRAKIVGSAPAPTTTTSAS